MLARQERASISVMLFWRRQRRATEVKRSSFREEMEEIRACTQSTSEVSGS